MSFIVASGAAICNSPLNLSKTKMMYSFSKASRFPPIKTDCTAAFYDLPSMKMTRAASIGKGTKYDFTAMRKGKSEAFYDWKTDSIAGKIRAPRYSMALGRENMHRVLEGTKESDKQVPGPAKYSYLKPFGSNASKYTMRGRFYPPDGKDKVPGPGAYHDPIIISDKGKFPSSRYENIHQVNFGADKTRRFIYNKEKSPGPADYPKKQLIGQIYESRFRSNMPLSMSFKWKNADSRNNYPGPGAYRYPSEWGIYESAKLHGSKSMGDIKG